MLGTRFQFQRQSTAKLRVCVPIRGSTVFTVHNLNYVEMKLFLDHRLTGKVNQLLTLLFASHTQGNTMLLDSEASALKRRAKIWIDTIFFTISL